MNLGLRIQYQILAPADLWLAQPRRPAEQRLAQAAGLLGLLVEDEGTVGELHSRA